MDIPLHHQDQSGFSRTFQEPDLCRAICSVLDKKHYANLLYLSRLTYDCTLPIVWEDTDFRALLLLIPGVTETRGDESPTSGGSELDYVFNLPSVPDLSRFNIHSPFIKTLRTTGSYIVHFPKKSPNPGAQTESELLLPNLKYLVINTSSLAKPEHGDDHHHSTATVTRSRTSERENAFYSIVHYSCAVCRSIISLIILDDATCTRGGTPTLQTRVGGEHIPRDKNPYKLCFILCYDYPLDCSKHC
ncbi:hypothetical protein FRC08_007164 [Ceratobasidium sp. 394]|nr:hypothetical protein FRC08_007164 [Ceratobasidium sp. 394]